MATDTRNPSSTADEPDALLIVPEEPETDEDPPYGAESATDTPLNSRPATQQSNNDVSLSFATAIRSAKWYATAYGYTPKKKSLYGPQEVILILMLQFLRQQLMF